MTSFVIFTGYTLKEKQQTYLNKLLGHHKPTEFHWFIFCMVQIVF